MYVCFSRKFKEKELWGNGVARGEEGVWTLKERQRSNSVSEIARWEEMWW